MKHLMIMLANRIALLYFSWSTKMHLHVLSKIAIDDLKVRESWTFTPENIEEKSRKC